MHGTTDGPISSTGSVRILVQQGFKVVGTAERLTIVIFRVAFSSGLCIVKIQELTAVTCYHCGDRCEEEHRVHAGKDFCCHGCEVVYDLLQESGLCNYYELEKQPGTKQAHTVDEQRLELFDVPAVRDRIIEFSESGISRARFHVPQMHCSSCIWLLENLHRIEPAILRSRVSFASKELTVNFRESTLALPRLVRLLRRIGYGPQLTANKDRAQELSVPRSMYIRLGVAGFIFGNTMMFSFPEYLGADTEAGLRTGFQWLTVLFSFPVVFYLSTDFFKSAWAGIRSRQVNIDQPIALGIVALWTRSLWDVITGIGPGYFDSLAGLLFFLLVGRWYQAYTYRALRFDRALEDFLPLVVLRKRGDREEPVKVNELIAGDHIIIRDQELIPVDAVLRAGIGHIDNSFITGEPLAIRKEVGATIKAGGRQRGAPIELEVISTFAESRLKRLWAEQGSSTERPAMPRMIDSIARRFTIAVLLISLGAALYWWGKDPAQVWPVVTAVLIVPCPCPLTLSMPFAYGHTIRLLGKRGLFLRDAEVVERMAHVDTVIFDKTGTLTAREAHEVKWHGETLGRDEKRAVQAIAHSSTHPLSAVLNTELKVDRGDERVDPQVLDVEESPGAGVRGTVDRHSIRIGSAAHCGAVEAERRNGEAHVHVTIDGLHRGYFTIRKRARGGIATAVTALRSKVRLGLLTGDAQVDTELAGSFAGALVRTNCSPIEKTRTVAAEQEAGHRVLMVGDGLNDAGALAQSDVGITVTETSAALTPASDAIMDAGSITSLPSFLLLTRRARRIVIGSLFISLCYNVAGVSFAVTGQLTPLIAAILMPLSSVTVVGFVSIAVALAADRKN